VRVVGPLRHDPMMPGARRDATPSLSWAA
jgi:hypothetical protein